MRSIVLSMMALVAIGDLAKAAPSTPASVEVNRCEALVSADFSRIQDAPTQITDAKLTEGKGSLPAYCQVRGYGHSAGRL